jgi:Mg-chelatase subunit ChlI
VTFHPQRGFTQPAGPPVDLPRTVGALRAGGHVQRNVKDEVRANLLDALRSGRNPWPGIVGFEDTVLPQLERALLAGHDVVLLGERGQGKTRSLRTLVGLLDEWTPVIDGAELASTPTSRSPPAQSVVPSNSATTCQWPGGTARCATPKNSPPRTPASVT